MDESLFIPRESQGNPDNTFEANTKGSGCLSSIVLGMVFGALVGLGTYGFGYPISTALAAAAGTLIGIVVLHITLTLFTWLCILLGGFLFVLGFGFLYSTMK